MSVRSARCDRENLSLTDRVASYLLQTHKDGHFTPGVAQQMSHCNLRFRCISLFCCTPLCEGLTPAVMSKTFTVLKFLIVGGACMGSRMIDFSS
ncbi:MAG: hypothetical protein HC903_06265 [Methylacidiphilales bacterium]|nr:hypothetical protein [Candidatus Methylacidiphilales bacterium]